MWKYFVIMLVIFETCNAENEVTSSGRAKYPFKYHHHHGLRYLTHYWIFLAIKAKIIFLIGTFISFWLFAGKAFAFLYYIKNKESCRCPEFHHEKVVLPEIPSFEHKYSTIFNAGPQTDYNGPLLDRFQSNSASSYQPQFLDHRKYSRSMENTIFDNIGIFKSIIKKADLTELAFDAMNLKRRACKERFICEANQDAKQSSLLAISLYMFSDVGFKKYSTNTTIQSKEDCASIGPYCDRILG